MLRIAFVDRVNGREVPRGPSRSLTVTSTPTASGSQIPVPSTGTVILSLDDGDPPARVAIGANPDPNAAGSALVASGASVSVLGVAGATVAAVIATDIQSQILDLASARRAADDVHDARLGTIDTERATTFNLASLRLLGPALADGDDAPYAGAIVSTLGRLFLGALRDGTIEIPRLYSTNAAQLGGLVLRRPAPADGDDFPYVAEVASTLGRVLLGFLADGGVEIPRLEQAPATAAAGDEVAFTWSLGYAAGQVPFGLERDGVFLRLSARGARDVGARLTPDPATFRGDHRPFNLRYGPAGTLIGTRQDADRTVYDIRQIEGGLYDTAVVSDSRPLPIRAYFGQSQAGGGGGDLAVITSAAYPRHVLAPAVYGKAFGGAVANGYLINDLVPLFDGQGGQQFINTLFGLYLERQNRDAGPAGPGVIAPTSTFGGQPLSAFAKGQTPYTNLMAILTACPPLAARYGRRSYTDAIVIVHGEAGPYGRSTYATPLGTLIDNLRADVQVINAAVGFNVPPQIFLTQQNQFDSNNVPTNTGVKLAQLDVAKSRLGQGVTMLGPMYQTQVQSDGIHMDNAGKALQAELHAHVVRRVLDDGVVGWNPLWPVSLANLPRSGAVITLDLVLPPGLASIAQDTDWVLAPADGRWGFAYTDDSGSPPAIASVAIGSGAPVGQARIVITLAGTPTGANRRLRYALGSPAPTGSWLGERGLVYADSGVPSRARETYPTLPATIRHYLVGFEATVS